MKETTQKIVLQKRILSRTSDNIQKNESLQTFNLQNTTNPILLVHGEDNSNDNSDEEVLLNERQEDIIYETPVEFHISESDFALSSNTDSDQLTTSEETEQQTRRVVPNQ